jgi:hypothetical protein
MGEPSREHDGRGHPCLVMGAHDCGGLKTSALACGVFFGSYTGQYIGDYHIMIHELGFPIDQSLFLGFLRFFPMNSAWPSKTNGWHFPMGFRSSW